MANVIDWNDVSSPKTGKDGIRNLKLASGKTFEVRFVGHPIKFYKYFNETTKKSALVLDAKENLIFRKYGKEPKLRYAANVLNRADSLVYVMEFPPSVYNDIRDWGIARKTDPGGKSGANFSIMITGAGKDTRYKCVGLDITPFTDAEKEYLRSNIYDLNKLFKETSEETIDSHLGYGFSTAGAAQAPATPATPATGAAVDLPF